MLRFLRENAALKIIALVTSLMIWFYVRNERNPNPTVSKTVAVEVAREGAPPSDLIVSVRREPLLVEVTGPKSEIDTIGENDIKAVVNVTHVTLTTTRLQILRYMNTPTAPDVTCTGRNYVMVDIYRKLSKALPIIPLFNAEAPFGSHYGKPVLLPQYASAVGAGDDLDKVSRLVCLIETKGASVSDYLPIKAQDKDGIEVPNVTVEPATVRVDLPLEEASATRTFIVDVPVTGKPAAPYEVAAVAASPATVTLNGKPDRLLKMSNVRTTPVSVEGAAADLSADVPLELPPEVSVVGGKPTVRITIKLREAAKGGPE